METDNGLNYLTLSYRQNPTAGGITVNVQTSTDLVNWTTASPPDLNQSIGTDSVTGDPLIKVGVKTSGSEGIHPSERDFAINVPNPTH
jgi:hypothetical protein